MKRVIKNYANIEPRHIELIEAAFPEGISPEDIKSLRMPDGQYLTCIEVKTEDTVYLFRMDGGLLRILEEETGDDFQIDGDDLGVETSGDDGDWDDD